MNPTAPLLLLLATAAARIFRIPLDTNSTFSWTLDYPAGTVSVEVHTTAGKDHWVAVGFSDYGALEGADLCVLWRDWRGHTHLQVCFCGLQFFVKNSYTEFHENPTGGSVADTRSQPDGQTDCSIQSAPSNGTGWAAGCLSVVQNAQTGSTAHPPFLLSRG